MKKLLALVLAFMLSTSIVAVTETAPRSPTVDDFFIDYLVLVNKEHKLPDNWERILELEEVEDFEGDHPHQVEKETLAKFWELREALLEEGIQIELDSCYRSVDAQIDIWNRFTEEYGEDYVKKYVAVPGYSEHHTGLAIDICLVKDGVTIDENDDMIAETEIFAKIHEKLADYGFILRYPEGKEEITGYGYEPWHFRFVQEPVIAHYIMDNNLTLEEFLEDHWESFIASYKNQ